jgi:hypothetical protein
VDMLLKSIFASNSLQESSRKVQKGSDWSTGSQVVLYNYILFYGDGNVNHQLVGFFIGKLSQQLT